MTQQMNQRQIIPNWIIIAFAVISFIGFVDATYLTATHYLGVPPNCSAFSGCEQVTTSEYSAIFGIPISLGGSIYYILLLLLSVAYIETKKQIILSFIKPIVTLGFIFSVWFVYLQLFVINAIFIYCMISASATTILFILSLYLSQKTDRRVS